MIKYNGSEDNEQIALFRWADFAMGKFPELKLMHHIPNGGSRNAREGAKLKKMGVRPGVCDVFLPVARGRWHGLYIEMKYGKNRTTTEQRAFINGVREQGYNAVVCYGWDGAAAVIVSYLTGLNVNADDINTVLANI